MESNFKIIKPITDKHVAEMLMEYDVFLVESVAYFEESDELADKDLAVLNQFLGEFGLQLPSSFVDIYFDIDSFNDGSAFVYQALKSLFGAPIMFSRYKEDDSDFFGFFLSWQNYLVCIGYEFGSDRVDITCFGASQAVAKKTVGDVKKLVEKEISKLSNQKSLQEPEPYQTSFDNLFHLYFNEARKLLEDLQGNEEQTYQLSDRFPELSPFFLFVASFEGFLNLIYELYLSEEYRNDDRVRDHLKRAPIDVKLRLAPAYCSCFKKKIIDSTENFKKFQAVTELRNDFVHANLSEVMIKHKIEIDGITFQKHSKPKRRRYDLPPSPYQLNLKHLEFVCEVIEHTVELVLSAMKPRHKRELDFVLHKRHFEARFIDGEYIVEIDEDSNKYLAA